MGVVDLVESIWNNESPDWKRYGSRYAKKLEIYNYEHESSIGNEEIYNYEGKYLKTIIPTVLRSVLRSYRPLFSMTIVHFQSLL